MSTPDQLHAARLALLEGALVALLRSRTADDPNTIPDAIEARLDIDGLDITYLRGSLPVDGEML